MPETYQLPVPHRLDHVHCHSSCASTTAVPRSWSHYGLISAIGLGGCSSPSPANGHSRTRLVGLGSNIFFAAMGQPNSRLPYCFCCHHRHRRHYTRRSRRRKTAAVLHPVTKDQGDRANSITRLPDLPHHPSAWSPPFSNFRGLTIREASPASIAKKWTEFSGRMRRYVRRAPSILKTFFERVTNLTAIGSRPAC